MTILLAGASGLLGRRLLRLLLDDGHSLALLSRDPERARGVVPAAVEILGWDGRTLGPWADVVERSDAVVNLAGESIGNGRWTSARKTVLMDSRVDSTRAIVQAIARASRKPEVLVSASAVGYYGDVPDGEATEERTSGNDFLAQVCVAWEQEASEARRSGVRVALPRTGIVLSRDGGALPRLLPAFRLFAGGPLGSGKQWFPWVHIEDEVRGIDHAIRTPSLSGPFNVAAPEYVRMKEFCKALGTALRRPSWAPVPAFVLKIVLGEMAGPLLLSGQKAVSTKLTRSGFSFRYPALREALNDVLSPA